MLGKKMGSFKKLAKKVKVNIGRSIDHELSSHEQSLLREIEEEEEEEGENSMETPNGYFAVYVGEEKERFVVATSYLNHPLMKMLLEKSYNEFGFAQQSKLVVPCNVSTFQEVVHAVECSNGRFDFGDLVEEFI
ncbi:auxin-induced protein X15 [Euphorbia lathyris]|uniref:auxin-induced protein X15 n=1 Tax=Euphorbia lathyris TaxID=212925 RepID=UPI00331357E9